MLKKKVLPSSNSWLLLGNDMYKLIKFTYYNIALGIVIWLVFLLYKINFWLAFVGAIIIIYLFIIITAKVLNYIKDL